MKIRNSVFTFCILLSLTIPVFGQYYYYVPEDGNLLALDDKDLFKASLSAKATESRDGWSGNYNFQAGHSPREHLAIVGNFFKFWRTPDADVQVRQSIKTHFGSIAVGTYFYKKKKQKNSQTTHSESRYSRGVLLDFYTGYGLGNSFREYKAGGRSEFHFQKFFVQGGIHLVEKRIGFSTVMRYNILDFNRGKINGKFDGFDRVVLDQLKGNNPHHLVELAFRFSMAIGKRVRVFYSNTTKLGGISLAKDSSGHFGLLFETGGSYNAKKSMKSKK